jgi:glycosyltransferase involved in cell wall biosynthesis
MLGLSARMGVRIGEVLSAISGDGSPTAKGTVAELANALGEAPSGAQVWLAWSVIVGELPTSKEMIWAKRKILLSGTEGFVHALVRRGRGGTDVTIVRDVIIVDLFHTSQTELATGIQRVARETARRWAETKNVTLATWTTDGTALRELTPSERLIGLYGISERGKLEPIPKHRIVPLGGHYIVPELAGEPWRTDRLRAMGRYADVKTNVIGFDTVPLTSVETVGEGMPAAFARNLTALTHFDRIGTISVAAHDEYAGWRQMLSAAGWTGPDIRPVFLATNAEEASDEDVAYAREKLGARDDEPVVLVVGSHEPRKNHLAVLAAAEMLWREGLDFRLVFVGGNSWKSETFKSELARLRESGRSVVAISAVSDALLWGAYRLARFTVFPSLNEGFGLPVAESLASGTPVVTTGYGSMREIADAGGGAVLVDPRDDRSIADGMRSLLTDDALLEYMTAQALARSPRKWNDYADELWNYFIAEVDASA